MCGSTNMASILDQESGVLLNKMTQPHSMDPQDLNFGLPQFHIPTHIDSHTGMIKGFSGAGFKLSSW